MADMHRRWFQGYRVLTPPTVFSQVFAVSDWQSAHGQHEICFYHEFNSTRLKAQLLVDMLYVCPFQVYTIFVPICQVQEESRIKYISAVVVLVC